MSTRPGPSRPADNRPPKRGPVPPTEPKTGRPAPKKLVDLRPLDGGRDVRCRPGESIEDFIARVVATAPPPDAALADTLRCLLPPVRVVAHVA